MIDIVNIEYNYWAFLKELTLFEDYDFSVDSFKKENADNAVCISSIGSSTDGDQGRSIEQIRFNILVRDKFEYLAKESLNTMYQTKEAFGFGKELPIYNNGEGFVVPVKPTSIIEATNSPTFVYTDDNGLPVYALSVEIKLSSE